MKVERENLDLEKSLQREWIITNGIGGYASSTIVGANTRRYHGLLVAPLLPPAKRHLLISKVDESIKIGEENYNLYTNLCKNYVSDGYKYLVTMDINHKRKTYKIQNKYPDNWDEFISLEESITDGGYLK